MKIITQANRDRMPLASLMLAILLATPLIAIAQAPDVNINTARAALAQRQPDRALNLLDGVVLQQPLNTMAHYYRGMALGLLARHEEAQHSFLTAAALAPGFADAHRYAAVASYQLGDTTRAWEQSILAARAGSDMNDAFSLLRATGDEPADLATRLDAPLIYVTTPDLTGVIHARNWGFEDRVGGVESIATGVGTESQGEAILNSDMPYNMAYSEETGGSITTAARTNYSSQQMLQENQGRIDEVLRQFRTMIAASQKIGLVASPDLARYELQLVVNELSGAMAGKLVGCDLMPTGSGGGGFGDADVDTDVYNAYHPKKLRGKLVLRNNVTGETVHEMTVDMRDISSIADLQFRVAGYVQQLQVWVSGRTGN